MLVEGCHRGFWCTYKKSKTYDFLPMVQPSAQAKDHLCLLAGVPAWFQHFCRFSHRCLGSMTVPRWLHEVADLTLEHSFSSPIRLWSPEPQWGRCTALSIYPAALPSHQGRLDMLRRSLLKHMFTESQLLDACCIFTHLTWLPRFHLVSCDSDTTGDLKITIFKASCEYHTFPLLRRS